MMAARTKALAEVEPIVPRMASIPRAERGAPSHVIGREGLR